MAILQYTAEAKGELLLELPTEAQELHLKHGDKVVVQLTLADSDRRAGDPTIQPHRVSALGKYSGVVHLEEYMRRKQEDVALEDRPSR